MRLFALCLTCTLSGCVPGCGGDATQAPEEHTSPVRLPSGGGDDPAGEGPVEVRDWADPPPVEPPPPLPAPSSE